MSKTVVLPNGLEVAFPTDATDSEMARAITDAMYASEKVSPPVEVEKPKATGKFFKSIPRGIDQVQGSIGSALDAIGEATGLQGLEEYGEKVKERNEIQLAEKEARDPRLALKDVKNVVRGQQSFVDYVQQSLGEVLPSMGLSLGGGYVGAKAGAGLGAKLGLTATAAIPIPGARVAGIGIGTLIGGAIGAFLPSALMGTGEVQSTIKELDPDARNPWAALGGGTIIGALDVASLAVPVFASMKKGIPKDTILKGLIKGGVKESTARGAIGTANKSLTQAVTAIKGRIPKGRLGKGLTVGLVGAGSEAFTERLQELTSIEIAEAVTDREVVGRAERLLEATVMGAIAGAGFGGGAGVLSGKNYDATAEAPAVERGAYDEMILSTSLGIPDTIVEAEEISTPVADVFAETELTNLAVPFASPEGRAQDPLMASILNAVPPIEETIITSDPIPGVAQTEYKTFGDTSGIRNQITAEAEADKVQLDIAATEAKITRGDQVAIAKIVGSKPIVWMKGIVTGDINYNNKDNKSQTKKAFAERIGKTDIKDKRTVNTIFNTLVKKGQIEKVGSNRWKYTDKSLNNKDLKAVEGQDIKTVQKSGEPVVNGNKTEVKFRVNNKDFVAIKETKEVKIPGAPAPIAEPTKKQTASEERIQKDVENVYEDISLVEGKEGSYEGTYLGKQFQVLESKSPSGQFVSTIFIEDNSGNLVEVEGASEIYVARDADKALKNQLNKVVRASAPVEEVVAPVVTTPTEEAETQIRWIVRGPSSKGGIKNIRNDKEFSTQTQTDEQQLASIESNIIGYVNEEFVGLRSQDKLVDMEFPSGLLLEEQFQVETLNKGIVNKSNKPYKSIQAMITDIRSYTKQILDIDDSLQVKQEEIKNFSDAPSTVKIIEGEIQELQGRKETLQESVDLLQDFLSGLSPVSSIGRTPTKKELRELLTPKQEAVVVTEEKKLDANVKLSKTSDGTGATYTPTEIASNAAAAVRAINAGEADTAKAALATGLATVNFYGDWLNSMQHIANKNPPFLPFHKLMRKYDEIFRGLTNRTTIIASPYASLTKESRPRVDRMLMAAMMTNTRAEKSPDGQSYIINIPANYSFMGYGEVYNKAGEKLTDQQEITKRIAEELKDNPDNPVYTTDYFQQALDMASGGRSRNEGTYNFKINEEVKISGDVETRALESMYTALDGLWDSYIQATVNATGRVSVAGAPSENNLYDNLKEIIENNIATNIKASETGQKNTDINYEPLPTTMGGVLQERANKILGRDGDGVLNDVKVLEKNPNELKTYNYYDDAATAIQNMENMKKDGYFPSVREGDGFARIYRTTTDAAGKEVKETFQRIEIIVPKWRAWKNNNNFDKSAQTYMDKHYPNWKDDYQVKNESGLSEFDESFSIEFVGKTETDDNASFDQNFESIERLLIEQDRIISETIDIGGNKTEATKQFEERLTNTFRAYNNAMKNRSFRSHTNRRKGIPGYVTPENKSTYVSEAFGLYTVKASRLVARMNTEDDIRGALRELQRQKDTTGNKAMLGGRSLFDVAKSNAEFVFSPQSSLAFFKTVAFNGFLGGNISSLMVNLSQNMVTASFLYGAYGLKGRGTVTSAFADSVRMIKSIVLVPAEFVIPPLAIEGTARSEMTPVQADGEKLYSKWKKYITRQEYRALAEQSAQGAFGKMNTEAIANNSDVTSKFLQTKIIGDAMPKEASDILAKRVGQVSKVLTSMYASGEMINRMTASLAAMRLANKFGVEELQNFSAGIPGQDRLINSTSQPPSSAGAKASFQQMIDAGITVSNATQFNLDPFNRSRLSRQLGGVPIQFLGFVTMMIEVYSNALFGRYGDQELSFMNNRQKQRMLVGLVGQQLALGGLFALPFMDDLDEVVQVVQDSTGMTKTSIYEVLYESLVDDAGFSPDTATALLRGPLEGYGPISVGKRIALSPFQNALNMRIDNIFQVPFKLIGGPSASFIEGWGERVIGSAREGRWDKAALYFPPTALTTNLANAFYNSTEGMQTGTGRQLNDGLDGMDRLWGAVGFTSTNVSTDREQIRRNKYINSRMRTLRDRYTDRITQAYLQMQRQTSQEKRNIYMNKITGWYKEILDHDVGKEPEDKIDPSYSIATSVGSRLKQAYSQNPGAIAPVSKALQGRSRELNRDN